MKKKISFLLALVFILSLALSACAPGGQKPSGNPSGPDNPSAGPTSGPDTPDDGSLPHYDIGILPWSLADTEIVRLMEWCGEIEKAFNVTFHWVQSTTDETLITNIETLIEAGCDAIMPYYITESVVETCDRNQVYFAQFCGKIDGTVLEAAEKSDYWLGGCSEDDTAAGLAMVQSLYDQGARNFTIIGIPAGQQPIGDLRFQAFADGIKTLQASDPTVKQLGEYRGLESPNAVENFLSLYPEMDGICNACGGGGRNESIVQALETSGAAGRVKYGAINAVEEYSYWFDNSALHFMICGQHPDAIFSFMMVYNALNGDRLSDTPVYMGMNYLYVTPDNMGDYAEYIMGSTFPYTIDELKQFVKKFNPDASIELLQEAVSSYSIEEVASRR